MPLPPGFEAMIAARRARRRRRRIIAIVLAVALAVAAGVAGARFVTGDPGADSAVDTSLDAAASTSGSPPGSATGSASGSPSEEPSTEASSPIESPVASTAPSPLPSTRPALVVLNVVDVSGSMAGQIGSGDALTTKIKATTTVLTDAFARYSEDDEAGLWAFSGGRNVADYTELVPIGPMDEAAGGTPRRSALTAALDRMRAKGRTSLYSTLTAAYSTITAAAAATAQNGSAPRRPLLVVVSDGRNDLDGGATLEQVLARIAAVPDAQRVPVMTIAFSSGADRATLAKIAEASGGTAFVADTAEELARVYAQALTTL